MQRSSLDDLIHTIAANHGLAAPAKAIKRKARDGEDDREDATAQDENNAVAAPDGAPVQLVLNEAGVAVSDAPLQLAQAEAGAATGAAAGTTATGGGTAATDGIGLGGLALGGLVLGGLAVAAGGGGGGGSSAPAAADTTAPVAPAIATVASDDIINAAEQTATITGTAEANASIALGLGGNTRTVAADGSGNWSYTLVAADITAMGQGAETLSATATDAAGNTGTAGTRNISIDTAAPTANFTSATDNVGTVTGALSGGGTTDDTALALAGTCESGSTVNVYNGTTLLGAATVTGTNWSYTAIVADGATCQFNVKETDAAGNTGTATGNFTVTGDTTAPTITGIAITSATGIQNSTLNAGDVVSATVTLSEATTVIGTPQLALNIGGTTVQANYASGSGTAALVFSYTILAGQTDANGISIAADTLSLNGGTLKDAAGNNATLTHSLVADNGGYLVDTAAPVFSSGATASVAENSATSTTVYDATADGDTGVAYTLGGTDAALFNINAATVAATFTTSPNYEAPADSGGNNIYDFTVTATDAAGNVTGQAVALTVTDVVEVVAAGDAVIDLGTYGKLIAPVNVDGNWYYHWDRSGDGTSANTGSLNGGLDITTHDVLDGIFNQDINGVTNTTVTNYDGLYGTTDTYRYATLNGVQLALPTLNGGTAYPNGINTYQPGTAIDNSPIGETNPTYDDLLAIWDGYNGTGTGANINGTPSGWQAAAYWSATPSAYGHPGVSLDSGYVYYYYNVDPYHAYVALQVL